MSTTLDLDPWTELTLTPPVTTYHSPLPEQRPARLHGGDYRRRPWSTTDGRASAHCYLLGLVERRLRKEGCNMLAGIVLDARRGWRQHEGERWAVDLVMPTASAPVEIHDVQQGGAVR